MLGGYYVHPQTEFWINGKNDQKFCNESVYEDPTCSSSIGPAYSIFDHGLYFDADYATCILGQPGEILAIPDSILQPVGTIPPLPQPISDFLGAAANFIETFLDPLFGR